MRNAHLENRTNAISSKRKGYSLWMKVVSILSAITVFCTTYALILPAITVSTNIYCDAEEHEHTGHCYEAQLICGLEETEEEVTAEAAETAEVAAEGITEVTAEVTTEEITAEEAAETAEPAHVHTSDCYELVLVCSKEVHAHGDACYSNPEADVETPDAWERTLPAAEDLTDSVRENMVLIAKSQIGYKESTANFQIVDDEHKGYNRYSHMFGNAYADWSVSFVQFAMFYAGLEVKVEDGIYDMGLWAEQEIKNNSLYTFDDANHEVKASDIVFLTSKNGENLDRIGIVEEVKKNNDGNITSIIVIEGDSKNEVRRNTYKANDGTIFGFVEIPEVDTAIDVPVAEAPVDEAPVAQEPEEETAKEEAAQEPAEEAAKDEAKSEPAAEEAVIQETANEPAAEEAKAIETLTLSTVTETGAEITLNAKDIELPANTSIDDLSLAAEEIQEGSKEYDAYKFVATKQVAKEEFVELTNAHFFDIAIVDSANEEVKIGDNSKTDVVIQFPETDIMQNAANAQGSEENVVLGDNTTVDVIHFGENGTDILETEANITGEQTVESVAFTTDSFKVFGVVETKEITKKLITAAGEIYEVKVSYTAEANIPEGAVLSVTEFGEGTEEYNHVNEIIENDFSTDGSDEGRTDVLDITILDAEGNEVEPEAAVDVKISVIGSTYFGGDMSVVHIKENKDGSVTPESVIVTTEASEESGKNYTFTVDGFSYYQIKWNDGKNQAKIFYGRMVNGVFKEYPGRYTSLPYRWDDQDKEGDQWGFAYNLVKDREYMNDGTGGKVSGVTVYYLDKEAAQKRNTDNRIDQYATASDINAYIQRGYGHNWCYSVPTEDGAKWVDIQGGSEIYVVYDDEPEYLKTADGENAGSGYQPIDTSKIPTLDDFDKNKIKHEKSLTSNNDGTYTVSLNVTGKGLENSDTEYADIIIIRDTTGSMRYKIGDTNDIRGTVLNNALRNIVNKVMDYNDLNPGAVQVSIVDFANSGDLVIQGSSNRNQLINVVNNPNRGAWWGGQTNWESGLMEASKVKTRENAKQYVVFLTDGEPNLRFTAGPYMYRESYGQRYNPGVAGVVKWEDVTQAEIDSKFADRTDGMRAFIASHAWNQGYPYGYAWEGGIHDMNNCADAAVEYAELIGNQGRLLNANGNNAYKFITIGLFGGATGNRLDKIAQAGTGDANTKAIMANNQQEIEAAFESLVGQFETRIGYRNVTIHDTLTLPTASALVDGSSENFNYFRYGGVYGNPWDGIETSNLNYYNADGSKKAFAALPASVKNQYAWNPANEAVAQFTDLQANTGEYNTKITWALGENFYLEDGVTYEVEVTVWPDQQSYDWASEYENGKTPVNTPPAAFVKGNGTYAVKTNNTQAHNNRVEYQVTRIVNGNATSSPIKSAGYPDPGNMPLDTMKINLLKEWASDQTTQALKNNTSSLNFNLTKGENVYIDNIQLTAANNWKKENVDISIGLLVSEPYQMDTTAIGKYKNFNIKDETGEVNTYVQLDDGHNYTFNELDNSAFYEFEPNTYHPFLIDGVAKMVKVTSNGAWQIVGGENTDYAVGKNTANESQKGDIIISKMLIDSSGTSMAHQKTGFSFEISITDANGQPYSATKENGEPYDSTKAIDGVKGVTMILLDENGEVVKKGDNNIEANNRNGKVINNTTGERTLPGGVQNTSKIEVPFIYDGYSIVFNGLPYGSKWTVKETSENHAYELAGYVLSSGRLEEGNSNFLPNVATNPAGSNDAIYTVGGAINSEKTYLDVHNKRKPSQIKIKKVDAAFNTKTLEGAEFQLIAAREMPETYVRAGRKYINVFESADVSDDNGFGATYIFPGGIDNMINGRGNAPSLGIRLDNQGFVVSTTTGERLLNGNGSIIRYLPTEVRPENITFTTGSDGTVNLGELPQGTYYLYETKAPDGYNALVDPITITIRGDGTVVTSGNHVVGNPDYSEFLVNDTHKLGATITVSNSAGIALPETGGIGTTIFTVAGMIMILVAAVALVVIKRTKSQEE